MGYAMHVGVSPNRLTKISLKAFSIDVITRICEAVRNFMCQILKAQFF